MAILLLSSFAHVLLTISWRDHVVRGMMYYRRALMLQSYLEKRYLGGTFLLLFICQSLPDL